MIGWVVYVVGVIWVLWGVGYLVFGGVMLIISDVEIGLGFLLLVVLIGVVLGVVGVVIGICIDCFEWVWFV